MPCGFCYACVLIQGAPSVARMASCEALAGTFVVPMTSPPNSCRTHGSSDSFDSTVEDAQCPYPRKKDLAILAVPPANADPQAVPLANPGHTLPSTGPVPLADPGHTAVPSIANPGHTLPSTGPVPPANRAVPETANPGHTLPSTGPVPPANRAVPETANPGHTLPSTGPVPLAVPSTANPGHTLPSTGPGPLANSGHTMPSTANPGHTLPSTGPVPLANPDHAVPSKPHVTPKKHRSRQSLNESGSPPESVTPPSSSATPAPVRKTQTKRSKSPSYWQTFDC